MSRWKLEIGIRPSGKDLYQGPSLNPNVLSTRVGGLPTDWRPPYVRLWFDLVPVGGKYYVDAQYVAFGNR